METVSLTKRHTSTPVNSRAGGMHWVAGVLAN